MSNTPISSKPLDALISLGFEKCGKWTINGEELQLQLERYQHECDVLYSFVVEDTVLYIGKSVRTLKQRLYGYLRPGNSQRTNIANHERLVSLLASKPEVDIYALVPGEPIEFRGWRLNVAAGLEDVLIEKLRPPWNGSTSNRAA
jgi:hypothetical protein